MKQANKPLPLASNKPNNQTCTFHKLATVDLSDRAKCKSSFNNHYRNTQPLESNLIYDHNISMKRWITGTKHQSNQKFEIMANGCGKDSISGTDRGSHSKNLKQKHRGFMTNYWTNHSQTTTTTTRITYPLQA